MAFKIDTHVHTSNSSLCGHVCAEEMVDLYIDAGYDAIFITDHYSKHYFSRLAQTNLARNWEETMDCLLDGYNKAKHAGDRRGLRVFLAPEFRLTAHPNDYLVYGLDADFFYDTPELHYLDLASARSTINAAGGIMVQAHPFRMRMEPTIVDGVEIINANTPRRGNEQAKAMAEKHGLLMTSGSDAHRKHHVAKGGMLLESPITSGSEFVEALRAGQAACFGSSLP